MMSLHYVRLCDTWIDVRRMWASYGVVRCCPLGAMHLHLDAARLSWAIDEASCQGAGCASGGKRCQWFIVGPCVGGPPLP